MNETPEDLGLATALVGLSHHVLHLFADVGRTYKLSQQQVELICAVIVRGKVGMTELGRSLHLEKSNLSNLVDRAEQRGLAMRTRDPDDRRVTWVELTSEGTRLAMQTHGDVTARLNQLVNHLPLKDQRQLTAVVEQMMAGVLTNP
jgi:DNA-binding MarR family transcriptional regulator